VAPPAVAGHAAAVARRLRTDDAIELEAMPAPRTPAMVDLDRVTPTDDGERPRGFRFPDPAWREMRAGAQCDDELPNPFGAAVLTSYTTRVVPVVRRRGRQPPALV
jgi:hypothetical protein